jgi:hypothetical protein
MASTDLRLTGQTPTNNKILTFSAWVKRGTLGAQAIMYWENNSNSSQNFRIATRSDDVLQILDYSGAVVMDYRTTQVFRDTNAWYHIVVVVDTTNATANDRTKLWVNGERVTSFGTQTTYSLNDSTQAQQSNYFCAIGSLTSQYWDGSMAHVHFIDGTAYDADTFGETDATTGIWKPKTAPSVTYGTNGFFLKFENSGAFGTDSSGNANTFTVNGTMTQTIDTPSNVFSALTPLRKCTNFSSTFSNGNTTATSSGGTANYYVARSSLSVSKGKWYMEAKLSSGTSGHIGIQNTESYTPELFNGGTGAFTGYSSTGYSYNTSGNQVNNNSSTAYGDTYTTGDILSVALDLDNNKLYFAKNGTWQNSGDPTSGATGTGSISIASDLTYIFGVDVSGGGASSTWQTNFGNGYFGTTAVSSAQNPDDGIGIFEYSVPTGYKALCTKSINAQEYD